MGVLLGSGVSVKEREREVEREKAFFQDIIWNHLECFKENGSLLEAMAKPSESGSLNGMKY